MTKYTVLGTYDVRFTVEAETADDADYMVSQGEAGNGDIEGFSVDKVTSKYDPSNYFWFDYEDERSHCTCGHLMEQHFAAGVVTADDDTKVPLQKCHDAACKCVLAIPAEPAEADPDGDDDEQTIRTVHLPAEDVAR